jgi:hypothetical protein
VPRERTTRYHMCVRGLSTTSKLNDLGTAWWAWKRDCGRFRNGSAAYRAKRVRSLVPRDIRTPHPSGPSSAGTTATRAARRHRHELIVLRQPKRL